MTDTKLRVDFMTDIAPGYPIILLSLGDDDPANHVGNDPWQATRQRKEKETQTKPERAYAKELT
jgi:hypothetical protein